MARTPERTARGAARCRGYYLGTADQCARWDLPRSGIRQGDGPDSPAKGSGVSLLIAFKGPPGAGKSTIARALSKQLGWPLIDKDDVKDVLDGQTSLAGPLAYGVMLSIVRRQVLQDLNVVVDSPLLRETYVGLRRLVAETGVRVAIVECRCSDEGAWRARIEGRQSQGLPAHHAVTWEAVQDHLRRQADTDYIITDPLLVVDTASPGPMVLHHVLAWLADLASGVAVRP